MAIRGPFGRPQKGEGRAHRPHRRHGAERERLVPVGVVELLEPPAAGPIVCTRTLSEPQRSPTSAKPAAMDAGIGHVDADARPPRGCRRGAARPRSRRARSRPRAMTATRAPSAARTSATARPMPLLPPVTTAVASANPRSMSVHFPSRRVRTRRRVVRAAARSSSAEPLAHGEPPRRRAWPGRSSGVTRRVLERERWRDVGERDHPRGRAPEPSRCVRSAE